MVRVWKYLIIKKLYNEPLENGDAVSAADVVRNLSREGLVVHKEEVKFSHIADEELFKAIGE